MCLRNALFKDPTSADKKQNSTAAPAKIHTLPLMLVLAWPRGRDSLPAGFLWGQWLLFPRAQRVKRGQTLKRQGKKEEKNVNTKLAPSSAWVSTFLYYSCVILPQRATMPHAFCLAFNLPWQRGWGEGGGQWGGAVKGEGGRGEGWGGQRSESVSCPTELSYWAELRSCVTAEVAVLGSPS